MLEWAPAAFLKGYNARKLKIRASKARLLLVLIAKIAQIPAFTTNISDLNRVLVLGRICTLPLLLPREKGGCYVGFELETSIDDVCMRHPVRHFYASHLVPHIPKIG